MQDSIKLANGRKRGLAEVGKLQCKMHDLCDDHVVRKALDECGLTGGDLKEAFISLEELVGLCGRSRQRVNEDGSVRSGGKTAANPSKYLVRCAFDMYMSTRLDVEYVRQQQQIRSTPGSGCRIGTDHSHKCEPCLGINIVIIRHT